MTDRVIPSTGETRPGAHIDLNQKRYAVGDRVLFDGAFGPAIGTIERLAGNTALVGVQAVQVNYIIGRIPVGTSERSLLERLKAAGAVCERAKAAARVAFETEQKRILREYRVK